MGSLQDLRRATDAIDPAAPIGDQLAAVSTLWRQAGRVRDLLAQTLVDQGVSWGEVGRKAGMSRQAAWKRYPRQ
ncbi:helix-turn-helix domain-containing protein [Micromonospora sp. MW-13]|uniref:helix-turn-helix domain-containing protein n=1 Tax=Micromonospora sp. MW-13 TaxID=2094022 RepID=UPI000E42F1BC|nr:helix-turn-helix domain-containing protein [Micromonospora sp. MW-13]